MVASLPLAEDFVYNVEASLLQSHVKNTKIIYFNATDNCHHLAKSKSKSYSCGRICFLSTQALLKHDFQTVYDDHMHNCCSCCFFNASSLCF